MELKGKLSEHQITAKEYTPGVVYHYTVYVSEHYDPAVSAALLIMFDYMNAVQAAAMEQLVGEGKAPAFVAVGLAPGHLIPMNGGETRYLRTDFDHATGDIPNFIAEELIPEIKRVTGLNISDDPDMRMTSGGSTGGAIAFSCCWNRNDQFRRGYLSSPSVHSLSGGAELVNYVTKCEPRPIRSYIACGEYESLGYWGHNVEAAVSLARAMFWNNYLYRYEYLEKKMHTWGMGDYGEQLRAMEYIWQDWQTPIATGEYNKYLRRYVRKESPWEEVSPAEMPAEKAACRFGTYEAEDGTILLNGTKAAGGFGSITGLAISCDEAFLYATDVCTRGIYCMTIGEDGALSNRRVLSAQLHLPPTAARLGANGLVSDSRDYLYFATEWGVQIAPAAGNICAILPLPGDLPADGIALKGSTLYVCSGEKCFKRQIQQTAKEPGILTKPADLGDPGQDFGALTNRVQKEYDKFTDEEALKKHLWETSFFYPHPAL